MGRLETEYQYKTICAGSKLRKFSGNGLVCEVGGFDEIMNNFQDVEVWNTCKLYDELDTGDTYIILLGK